MRGDETFGAVNGKLLVIKGAKADEARREVQSWLKKIKALSAQWITDIAPHPLKIKKWITSDTS